MAIIDDLKKRTEEGLKTLKETAQDIAFNVEKQAVIGKKRYLDISRIQRNIHKVHAEIGEYVYEQFTSGKTIDKNDTFIQNRISAIKMMHLSIKDIEEDIMNIQKTQPSKHEP